MVIGRRARQEVRRQFREEEKVAQTGVYSRTGGKGRERGRGRMNKMR